jgi:hypothetical protein
MAKPKKKLPGKPLFNRICEHMGMRDAFATAHFKGSRSGKRDNFGIILYSTPVDKPDHVTVAVVDPEERNRVRMVSPPSSRPAERNYATDNLVHRSKVRFRGDKVYLMVAGKRFRIDKKEK